MYPVIRMVKDLIKHRNDPPLPPMGTHVSHHRCWPWDIDLWMELNNGRTLTLLDLGRMPLAYRIGLIDVLRQKRWSMTMAGVTVRYRRRIRAFEKFEMRSRTAGWDGKFIYVEQSMWKKNGDCASHVMLRTAVTDKNGIVPPAKVLEALGQDAEASPELPGWIRDWCQADSGRPWPPMQDGLA